MVESVVRRCAHPSVDQEEMVQGIIVRLWQKETDIQCDERLLYRIIYTTFVDHVRTICGRLSTSRFHTPRRLLRLGPRLSDKPTHRDTNTLSDPEEYPDIPMTSIQRKVVDLKMRGLTHKQVGHVLKISQTGVTFHLQQLQAALLKESELDPTFKEALHYFVRHHLQWTGLAPVRSTRKVCKARRKGTGT